jgi:16S rRNA (adenine1518-N6/adenine1519-N6)-dimethyltransferase
MTSPKAFVRETGFRPSRALGQNFLIHEDSARKIVRWAGVPSGSIVLEIGPGLGALTQALGEAGCRVIAVEKDRRLGAFLKENFKDADWLEIRTMDALELEPPEENLHVVSNLPYSVSTPLFERLLSFSDHICTMTLLVQDELVQRICAPPGSKEYGRLSIWIQTLCSVEKGPKIPKGSFHPQPKVESRLVKLTPREEPLVPKKDVVPFLKFIGDLFLHRRKSIRNSLRDTGYGNLDLPILSQRPETLSIRDAYSLYIEVPKPPVSS